MDIWKKLFLCLMVGTTPMATASMLQSCKDEEEHEMTRKESSHLSAEGCFEVEINVVDDTVEGLIVGVPYELNDSTIPIGIFPRMTLIEFPKKDVDIELSRGDTISIQLIDFEFCQDCVYPAIYSTPILAHKVVTCN
jgi:hypothetical protein